MRNSSTNKIKITSLVMMGVVAILTILSVIQYYQTKLAFKSPFIPDYVVEQFTRPHLVFVITGLLVVIMSVALFFRSRYKLTIAICVMAIIFKLSLPRFM